MDRTDAAADADDLGCAGCRVMGPLLSGPWQCQTCGTVWRAGAPTSPETDGEADH